jgi:hypothetical protein
MVEIFVHSGVSLRAFASRRLLQFHWLLCSRHAASDARFLNALELAYRFGKRIVVLSNSSKIATVLEPFLRRDLQGSGRTLIA